MKKFLLIIFCPLLMFGQTQIGADIEGEGFEDYLGKSVSLSSDGLVMAIGAYGYDGANGDNSGYVRVFQNQSGSWVQIGSDIDGEAEYNLSGYSVSLSSDGSIVAIGAPYNDGVNGIDSGQVRVYQNQSGSWVQIGSDIDGEAADDLSGNSVSLSSDGSVVAIGAFLNDGVNGIDSGQVRVYQNQSGSWVQIGSDLDGEAAYDYFGGPASLSSDGSIVAIGAQSNEGVNGVYSGHVRVYQNQSGSWIQIGSDIDGEAQLDASGFSVSLSSDGSIVAIGALGNDGVNGNSSGHVRVYQNQSGSWVQIGSDIDGEAVQDNSGWSVSLSSDGSIVAIGAIYNNGAIGENTGHVRVYQNQLGSWVQIGVDIDGEGIYDEFGTSISLSSDGSVLAIGAPYNDGVNGDRSGQVRVYDLSALLTIEESTLLGFNMYPNPVKDILTIKLENTTVLEQVIIYNILGQEILTTKETILNTSKLSSGSYIVKVNTNKGEVTKKLIIKSR